MRRHPFASPNGNARASTIQGFSSTVQGFSSTLRLVRAAFSPKRLRKNSHPSRTRVPTVTDKGLLKFHI
jgi:hypothetical protein